VIKTPLDKIEDEVERYFSGLYARIFDQGSVYPAFDTGDWTDGMGNPLPLR
jgi:hypothetical protein